MDRPKRKKARAEEKTGKAGQRKPAADGVDKTSLYPRLIESIPDMLVYTDLKGTILMVSNRTVLGHGYRQAADLIGKKASDLIAAEERTLVEETIGKLHKSRTMIIEHTLIRKDGSFFPAEVYISLVQDETGSPCGILSIARDITERRRAESALKESEERYRLVSQLSVDYFFKVDISPDGAPGLSYVSENIKAITGRQQDDITGLDQWISVIHPDDQGRFLTFYRKVMTDGLDDSLECRSFLKSGDMRWINVAVHPTLDPSGGRVISILGTVKDITERKQAEEKIMASLSEKETLLKEIHHRVKNNMQIITSLLNLQAHYIDNVELGKHFTEAENRIRSMALVHEKLYQSGDLGHIDFSLYLSELASTIMYSYTTTTRRIIMNIDARPVFLSINQAIPAGLLVTELLSNAIKHAFPAGWDGSPEVLISLRETNGGTVELAVGDNGIGLPGDRGIGSDKSLGLSLVPMLADQLNGTVVLDRSRGAVFTITFKKQ